HPGDFHRQRVSLPRCDERATYEEDENSFHLVITLRQQTRQELWRNESLPQNLLHRFSFCQLINQLVQIAHISHEWIFNFFYAHTAHYALDKRAICMNAWRLSKKGFKIVFLFDLLP